MCTSSYALPTIELRLLDATIRQMLSKLLQISPTREPSIGIIFIFPNCDHALLASAQHLYLHEPLFRQSIDRLIAEHHLPFDPLFAVEDNLTTFLCQYAIAQIWLDLGVSPQFVVGRGVGEYVAATIARVVSVADAIRLVRCELMEFKRVIDSIVFNNNNDCSIKLLTPNDALIDANYWIKQQSGTHVEYGTSVDAIRLKYPPSYTHQHRLQFFRQHSHFNLSPPTII